MNRTRMAEKLEAEIAAVQTFVMLEHVDNDGHLWCPARGIERIKRIASIMRRLKRCNECLRGKIPELEERGRPDRIRAILETHELVPVDQRARIKAGKAVLELWRDLSGRAQMPDLRYDCDKEVRAEIFCAWRDRLLGVARKQDTRPFDPTLCGFDHTENSPIHDAWRSGSGVLIVRYYNDDSGKINHKAALIAIDFPWPANQSDGEKLLELLGMLEK